MSIAIPGFDLLIQLTRTGRSFHGGHPRAGESGENIVVLPNIDTIDVSAVDTSLMGHTYYGDNTTVLYC
jgi:hypothetical protein